MRSILRKSGFTLMEVNLAVFIMAAGVLAMISLYPLAYRENSQSVEDVKAAAYADAAFNQIAGILSARNITWDEWRSRVENAMGETKIPLNGGRADEVAWAFYAKNTSSTREDAWEPKSKSEVSRTGGRVFKALTGGRGEWPGDRDKDYACALMAQWGWFDFGDGNPQDDHSRVILSMRVSRNTGALFAQPIFYTEIHFQGDQKE